MGTFCIGALSRLDMTSDATQILILCPTRELAKQNYDVLTSIGCYLTGGRDTGGRDSTGLHAYLCTGGTMVSRDIEAFRRERYQVVVGTPGRIYHLITKHCLDVSQIKLFVLDEADQMLSRDFERQVYDIYRSLASGVQFCIVSATFPQSIEDLSNQILNDPVRIRVPTEKLSLEGIIQYYVMVGNQDNKYSTLIDIFSIITHSQSIIYVNSVGSCKTLVEHMKHDGYSVVGIHSAMEQPERTDVLKTFRTGATRILVATDLVARGIDIQQISLVINYDLTRNRETYLHRIGRSGRFGRKGATIIFATSDDMRIIDDLERHYRITIGELPEDFNKRI